MTLASRATTARAGATTLPTTRAFAPTSAYVVRQVRGWTVRINHELLDRDPAVAADALALLDAKLLDVTRAVPPAALVKLKGVCIWLEQQDLKFPGAAYHPSRQWLTENGFNPDKAGGVELGNARNFLTWSGDQPAMVLHELAHAYHDRVLGYDEAEIQAAYEAARDSGIYQRVLRINGHVERAYAMNNSQEYFAELSEAFFGTNDFFPFVRAEVRNHDPRMFEVLARVWGRP